jgi:hypothetical protein
MEQKYKEFLDNITLEAKDDFLSRLLSNYMNGETKMVVEELRFFADSYKDFQEYFAKGVRVR